MDISLLILDLEKQNVEFSGAHNSIYLLRDGGIIEYKADQMPIGIQISENIPFTRQLIHVKKGDVLYALTDGFVDQFGGPKGKRFMLKNFKTLLGEIYNKSMDEQKNLLNETLENWMAETSQIDDILVMGIRI
jgi:serine phosphatase RsbU (regulator of sigma subunit)